MFTVQIIESMERRMADRLLNEDYYEEENAPSNLKQAFQSTKEKETGLERVTRVKFSLDERKKEIEHYKKVA